MSRAQGRMDGNETHPENYVLFKQLCFPAEYLALLSHQGDGWEMREGT